MRELNQHLVWSVEAQFARALPERVLAWWWARGQSQRVIDLLEARVWSDAPYLALVGSAHSSHIVETARARATQLAELGNPKPLRDMQVTLGEAELGHEASAGSLLAVMKGQDDVVTRQVREGGRQQDLAELENIAKQTDEQYQEGLITQNEAGGAALALASAKGQAEPLIRSDIDQTLKSIQVASPLRTVSRRMWTALTEQDPLDAYRIEKIASRNPPSLEHARDFAAQHPELAAKLRKIKRCVPFTCLLDGGARAFIEDRFRLDRTDGWHTRECHLLAGLLRDNDLDERVLRRALNVPTGCIELGLVSHLVAAAGFANPLDGEELSGRRAHAIDRIRKRAQAWIT